MNLRQKLRDTLMLESGINDPMAIFLTVSLTMLVAAQPADATADLAGFASSLPSRPGSALWRGLAADGCSPG